MEFVTTHPSFGAHSSVKSKKQRSTCVAHQYAGCPCCWFELPDMMVLIICKLPRDVLCAIAPRKLEFVAKVQLTMLSAFVPCMKTIDEPPPSTFKPFVSLPANRQFRAVNRASVISTCPEPVLMSERHDTLSVNVQASSERTAPQRRKRLFAGKSRRSRGQDVWSWTRNDIERRLI